MSIALVGAGAMGGALLTGWLSAGYDPADIVVIEPDEQRAEFIAEQHDVTVLSRPTSPAADVVVLAVKPHLIFEALSDLTSILRPHTAVVSIAAGVPLAAIEEHLPSGSTAFRVMPNTPALVAEAMSAIVPGDDASAQQIATVRALFDAVGKTVVLPERLIDAFTGIAGSGPAYVFYIAEAMIEAGVHQGLPRGVATEAVAQTFVGSAALLANSGLSATQLREQVTSPAGTTAAALRHLDDAAVRSGVLGAIEACVARAKQLAEG